jgi:hypothetical protein
MSLQGIQGTQGATGATGAIGATGPAGAAASITLKNVTSDTSAFFDGGVLPGSQYYKNGMLDVVSNAWRPA